MSQGCLPILTEKSEMLSKTFATFMRLRGQKLEIKEQPRAERGGSSGTPSRPWAGTEKSDILGIVRNYK